VISGIAVPGLQKHSTFWGREKSQWFETNHRNLTLALQIEYAQPKKKKHVLIADFPYRHLPGRLLQLFYNKMANLLSTAESDWSSSLSPINNYSRVGETSAPCSYSTRPPLSCTTNPAWPASLEPISSLRLHSHIGWSAESFSNPDAEKDVGEDDPFRSDWPYW
jgi:hypothetical protein